MSKKDHLLHGLGSWRDGWGGIRIDLPFFLCVDCIAWHGLALGDDGMCEEFLRVTNLILSVRLCFVSILLTWVC
jgi:hypothetical protein